MTCFRREAIEVSVAAGDRKRRPAGNHARPGNEAFVNGVAKIHREKGSDPTSRTVVNPASSVLGFFIAVNACLERRVAELIDGIVAVRAEPRWVWQSIRPGRTVRCERSITVDPAGMAELPASTDLIRSPSTTITTLSRTFSEVLSNRCPARMYVVLRTGLGRLREERKSAEKEDEGLRKNFHRAGL